METESDGTADRFAGLAEHFEHLAGPRTDEPLTAHDHPIVLHHLPDDGPVTVISDGLREQPLTASMEQEIACTVHPEQADVAVQLVDTVCTLLIEREHGIEEGEILTVDPARPGSAIGGVLAGAHPFLPEEFDGFTDADGTLVLQVLTLIPVTTDEVAFLRDNDADDLLDKWADEGTDLLDLDREGPIR